MTTRANQPNGHQHQHQHHQDTQHRPYAPTRDRHYLSSSSSSSSSSASLKGCCCCLFLLLILLALLAVAVALVIVLALRPRKPQFDLNQVAVQYLLLTPSTSPSATPAVVSSTPAAAYLSLNISLLFTAQNPNRVGIKYGDCLFYVMYRGVPLGVASVPGFEQPAHSVRLLVTRVSVSRVNVLQADALELIRDAAVNDRVELRITGDVPARIRLAGFTTPRVQVSVDCVIVISPRRQSVTYKQCGVDGLNV